MQRIVFSPPTNIVILARCVSSEDDLDAPGRSLDYVVLNGITPATASTTHQFWAVNRNFRVDDPALTHAFYDQSLKTFVEDIDVLESQQRRMEELGESREWLNVANDAAGVLARRMVAKLLAQAQRDQTVQSVPTGN